MTDNGFILDTPDQIGAWLVLSRMHELAMEINTPMRGRIPALTKLYLEGFLANKIRGTKANKQMVLAALLKHYQTLRTDYKPSPHIAKALEGYNG